MSKKIAGIAVGSVLTIIFILASAIQIAKTLLPFFLLGVGISVVWLVISLIKTYFDMFGDYVEAATWPVASIFIFVLLAGITYFVGHIFGDSEVGKAVTTVNDAYITVSEVQKNATFALIDASQQTTHEIASRSNDSKSKENEKITNATYDILRIAVESER